MEEQTAFEKYSEKSGKAKKRHEELKVEVAGLKEKYDLGENRLDQLYPQRGFLVETLSERNYDVLLKSALDNCESEIRRLEEFAGEYTDKFLEARCELPLGSAELMEELVNGIKQEYGI